MPTRLQPTPAVTVVAPDALDHAIAQQLALIPPEHRASVLWHTQRLLCWHHSRADREFALAPRHERTWKEITTDWMKPRVVGSWPHVVGKDALALDYDFEVRQHMRWYRRDWEFLFMPQDDLSEWTVRIIGSEGESNPSLNELWLTRKELV